MKKLIVVLFSLFLSSHTLAQSPHGDFTKILNDFGVDEAGLIVMDKKHQVVFQATHGEMNLDEIIPIASATKWITSAISLRVLKQNNVHIDTPIGKYLKDLGHQGLDKRKYMITFRQLLSFQSSLKGNVKCMYISLFRMNTKKCATRVLKKSDLHDKAGFDYNSAHMTVLGYLLEHISGKKWNDIFQEQFKTPFGITDENVMYYGSPKHRRGLDNPLVPGGLVISTNQYRQFLQMLMSGGKLNGKVYLDQAQLQEMHKDQFPSKNYKVYNTPYKDTGANPHYGLGNWVESEAINSSGGAFGFYPWIDQQENYYAIYTTVGKMKESQRSFKIVKKIREMIIPKVIK